MQLVGHVKEIWRYPVKGMAGERLQTAEITEKGIAGDRLWAVRDVARQEIQSCKFRPALLQCRALTAGTEKAPQVAIQFPHGQSLTSDDDTVHQAISALVGHDSTLEFVRPVETEADFYKRYKANDHTWLEELKATFDREPGEPLPNLDQMSAEATEFVSLPGTFFLVTPFHLITTATLAHMKQLHPHSDWAVERFRPNLVIETLPEFTGLVEQNWLDKTLLTETATIQAAGTTPRCGAVTRKQQALPTDTDLLRTIVKQGAQNLGIYGQIPKAGVLKVGDPIYLAVSKS